MEGIHVINTDALDLFATIGTNKVDLMILDPPYNYKQEYAGYSDNDPAFELNLCKWLDGAAATLAKQGSMWVFIPDEHVSLVDTYVRKNLFMHRRSWIIWYYTFGVNCKSNFTRSHTHILYFTKSKKDFVFNKDAVPSQRERIGDKRAAQGGRHPDNTWILHPSQLPNAFDDSFDVWLQSRICGTFHEREVHSPNQLPLALIERIIKVATNEGDIVCDPFLGTGTTAVACKRMNRFFIGSDISSICTEKVKERLKGMDNDRH